MNIVFILQIIITISITVRDVDGVITQAIGANYTKLLRKIWLKANHLMLNYLPDTTYNDYYRLREPGGDALSGRRIIRELIAAQDKREQSKDNQKFETDYDKYVNFIRETQPNVESATANELKVSPESGIPNDVAYMPYNKNVALREIKEIGMNTLRSIGRRDTIEAIPTHRSHSDEKRIMQDHTNKIQEITDVLWTHYEITKYVYKEIKRIAEKGIIKDNLRLMVDVLEQRGMENVKKEVLKCFYKSKKEEKKGALDYWLRYNPNNLIIETQ